MRQSRLFGVELAVSKARHTMRTIDHHDFPLVLLSQCCARGFNALGVVVCALGTASQDDEAVLVALCPSDGSKTLLRHTQEVVLSGRGAERIHADCEATIRSVLESNGERQAGCELSVQLRLGRPRANRTKRNEVCEELWGDGIEHLAGDWHTGASQVCEELPANAETLVDLVGLVNVRVVDQTLPADGGAGLLEVGAHDDAEVVAELVGKLS